MGEIKAMTESWLLRIRWKQAGKIYYVLLYKQANTCINTQVICIRNLAHTYVVGLSFDVIVLVFYSELESRIVPSVLFMWVLINYRCRFGLLCHL